MKTIKHFIVEIRKTEKSEREKAKQEENPFKDPEVHKCRFPRS